MNSTTTLVAVYRFIDGAETLTVAPSHEWPDYMTEAEEIAETLRRR
jgi:hypothetical protein